MSDSLAVFRNTASLWGSRIIVFIAGFVIVPLVIAKLGKEAYGLIALVQTIFMWSMMIDLGLSTAIGREMASCQSRDDSEGIWRIVSTSVVCYWTLAAAATIALNIFAGSILEVLKVPDHYMTSALWLCRVIVPFQIWVMVTFTVFKGVVASQNRFNVLNHMEGVAAICYHGGSILLVSVFPSLGIWGVAIPMTTSFVIRLVNAFVWAFRLEPNLQISMCWFSWGELRRLYRMGLALSGLHVANTVSYQAGPFLLSSFFGTPILAVYRPCTSMIEKIRMFVHSMVDQLFPVSTKYFESNDIPKLQDLLIRATRLTMLLGNVAVCGIWFFVDEFCHFWLGKALAPEDVEKVATILKMLMTVELFVYMTGAPWSVLLGMKKLKFLLFNQGIAAVLIVGSSWLALKFLDWGVYSVVIPVMVFTVFRRPATVLYTMFTLKINPKRYFAEAFGRSFFVLAILAAYGWGATVLVPADKVLFFVLHVIAFIGVWATAVWFVGLAPSDRDTVRRIKDKMSAKFADRNKAANER